MCNEKAIKILEDQIMIFDRLVEDNKEELVEKVCQIFEDDSFFDNGLEGMVSKLFEFSELLPLIRKYERNDSCLHSLFCSRHKILELNKEKEVEKV